MRTLRLLLVLSAGWNLSAAGWEGRWKGTVDSNGSPVRVFVTLTEQESRDGSQSARQISGTVATGDETRPVPIERAELRGEVLTFEVRDNAGRMVSFRLTRSGRVLSGESRVGNQISKVSLSTAVAEGVAAFGSGSGDRRPPAGADEKRALPASGVYRVGGGVSAPVLIHKVEPEYTEQARSAGYQGTVLLSVEIDPSGNAVNLRVMRSLGLGLDEKAVEAVKQWRFKPGEKDGAPVTVAATIEVNFRM